MNILVIRFSSLGDVLLTIPVFRTLEQKEPDNKYFLLTRPKFEAYFTSLSNVEVIPADIDHQYKGILGLTKLAAQLKSYSFDILVDLHDVLRTKILRKLLQSSISNIIVFNKGRKEKKTVISKKTALQPLLHTSIRYLKALDFQNKQLELIESNWLATSKDISQISYLNQNYLLPKSAKWFGIAPFSKHNSKEWIESNWLEVIQHISKIKGQIFVFAFGQREKEIALQWQNNYSNNIIIDETISIEDQMAIIENLDIMISVDSANMHLASLLRTKVLSIWLSTHPFLGFSPLENSDNIVQPTAKEAPWRPLSVYGKLKTRKENQLAEQTKALITVQMVLEKLNKILV
ncbi:MAG: glycosyltransferase family 9 protein [Chitinophagales bacterium]